MIPNRTVSITGIFAADASTIIPATPVAGQSYRDETMTGTVVREGWAFKTIVDSSKFNQAMYEYSSVTSQIEKYGFLPWSNLTDYVAGSVCLGSNGTIYQANQATGPSTTAYDPTTSSGIWTQVTLGVSEFLFHHVWSEYILNRLDWLRADTFSWQNGVTYSNAYNHLVDDYTNGTSTTETVGSYTITYVLAADGHKITTDETTVANIYNESGVAWYYILDTANQRFKLPRENPAREVLGQSAAVVGNGKSLGITNGTQTGGLTNHGSTGLYVHVGVDPSSYAIGSTLAASHPPSTDKALGISTDPTKSGMIAKLSETTGVYKGKQYLYFYVGQFTQTATEQTAGLNSELFNGKVDLNAANLSTAGKSLISCLGMPSDSYEDLTLGASGSTYTAPANGYFSVSKYANGANQFLGMYNATNKIACFWNNPVNGNQCEQFIPVKEGDVIQVNYSLGGNTQRFVFIYAEGEENV